MALCDSLMISKDRPSAHPRVRNMEVGCGTYTSSLLVSGPPRDEAVIFSMEPYFVIGTVGRNEDTDSTQQNDCKKGVSRAGAYGGLVNV